MPKALNIRFENLEFYIGAKYGRLAVSKEDNYFFSISIPYMTASKSEFGSFIVDSRI